MACPNGLAPGLLHRVYYVYDGDRLLEEIDAQGNVLASYVYGLYVDEPLQMVRGGQTYRYLQDDQYSVLS